jgi:hypothetical protein
MKEKELLLKTKLQQARQLLYEAEELSKKITSLPEYNTDRDFYSDFEGTFYSFASQLSDPIDLIDRKIEYDKIDPWQVG